jgi:hypothetical protein
MKRGRLPLIVAALLTLALAGAWTLHSRRQEQRESRREAWTQYLRGPLSDLLYGSTRIRPLMLKKALTAQDREQAKDAVEHLHRSALGMPPLLAGLEKDPLYSALREAALWHEQIATLWENWSGIVGRPLAREALAVEADMRLNLHRRLTSQKEALWKAMPMRQETLLETNAMLYSLKEETEK